MGRRQSIAPAFAEKVQLRKPESVQVKLSLFRFAEISGTWRPNEAERLAAWELYVQLVTRIGVVPLRDGTLAEALTSLYTVFGETREILKKYGPEVAEPKSDGEFNFGYLAVAVLNYTLRPVLSYWHPELEDWATQKPPGTSLIAHERDWERSQELRETLIRTGKELRDFVAILATACNVPDLLRAVPEVEA